MIKDLFDFTKVFKVKEDKKFDLKAIIEILNNCKDIPKLTSHHKTNFHYSWNNFNTLLDYQKKSLAEQILSAAFREFVDNKKEIKKLNFRDYCFSCGKYVEFELMENEYIEKNHSCFTEHQPKRQIEFKTGNLVASDYFRFKNGIKLSKLVKDDDHVDLNCALGLLQETDLYLSKNIVKVQVGNSSPSIIQKNNNLFFAQAKENDNSDYPYVCTDLWAVTLCEKEVLVDFLIKEGLTEEEALSQIKETTNAEIKVDAGLYEFEFNVVSQHLPDVEIFDTLYFTLKKID